MGKSPMAYHGHERSRHHNYSRNSQSRNRRSENQGFAPANYIYSPDRFLRQLPSYRRDIQQRGPGPSQQYFKGRSFHNRPYRSPLVQKRLPPQRKHTRRNMHPPGESAAASKSSEQSTDVLKNEKESSSEGQNMEEDKSSNIVQASVPQTRASTKAQQNKSEENTGANKVDTEDGSGMSQSSPQTRSSTKAHNKSEEIVVSDKSENEDSDSKVNRTTRGNSKVKNDDKSSCTVEVHLIEERVSGHNTRSATKARLDVSDESELQEDGGNIPKIRKVRKDTRTVPGMEDDTESTHRQESDGLALTDIEKTSHSEDHLTDSGGQVSEDLNLEVSGTGECTKETVVSEELMTGNDKDASTTLPSVKQLVGSKSPRLILQQIDAHAEKQREPSSEKGTNTTSSNIAEMKDSPRRSSRLGSSRMKGEETQLSSRTPRREHSRTPIRNQQSVEPRVSGDSFAASIRSITCRRSIRDSPSNLIINDSFQKHKAIKEHVQVTVKKTNKEFLSGTNLDVSPEKTTDVTTESDESPLSSDKIGKRKASTLENVEKEQEHKKKCILKSEQNSVISAVSSPLQLLTQKPEPINTSTPVKIVECSETVHMELSEESITDESVAYEKARDNISEQSLSFEKGAPVPEHICEPASRKWCSVM